LIRRSSRSPNFAKIGAANMSDLGYTQVKNVERRTWDKEDFESRAKARLEGGDDYEAKEEESKASGKRARKEEFLPAEPGSQGPAGSKRAYLKARTEKVELDAHLGKTQVVTMSAIGGQQGGYWCETCKCLLKDSNAYLDHINGKKHQRSLGFTMRVERSSVNSVKGRLDALKAAQEEKAKSLGGKKKTPIEEYEERLAEAAAAEESAKQERKEAAAAGKAAAKAAKAAPAQEEEVDEEAAAMAAMMGFKGFGGGK
jgi:U4/U6.U5 tri-snRNP component SNU23